MKEPPLRDGLPGIPSIWLSRAHRAAPRVALQPSGTARGLSVPLPLEQLRVAPARRDG